MTGEVGASRACPSQTGQFEGVASPGEHRPCDGAADDSRSVPSVRIGSSASSRRQRQHLLAEPPRLFQVRLAGADEFMQSRRGPLSRHQTVTVTGRNAATDSENASTMASSGRSAAGAIVAPAPEPTLIS